MINIITEVSKSIVEEMELTAEQQMIVQLMASAIFHRVGDGYICIPYANAFTFDELSFIILHEYYHASTGDYMNDYEADRFAARYIPSKIGIIAIHKAIKLIMEHFKGDEKKEKLSEIILYARDLNLKEVNNGRH